jgi:phosphoribosylaminoimidazole carboxylase PurE protein
MSAQVGIVVGSKSDLGVMEGCTKVLDNYGIEWEQGVISAHRAPDAVRKYASSARERGLKVLIGGAGAAAHLPGVLASLTTLPVIGVPIAATPLAGFDSLLSIVQMPPGVPVATVAIGEMGARNAAHLTAQILALSDERIHERIAEFRAKQAESAELPEGAIPAEA